MLDASSGSATCAVDKVLRLAWNVAISMAAGILLPATSATARTTRLSSLGPSGARKDIIVVACDGICRARGVGDRKTGNLRRRPGQKPGLNFPRDLQVAFHDHAIGDLEYQQ